MILNTMNLFHGLLSNIVSGTKSSLKPLLISSSTNYAFCWKLAARLWFGHASCAEDLFRQPKDDGCGDADGGHEGVGATVIAGVDPSPVLESLTQKFM